MEERLKQCQARAPSSVGLICFTCSLWNSLCLSKLCSYWTGVRAVSYWTSTRISKSPYPLFPK